VKKEQLVDRNPEHAAQGSQSEILPADLLGRQEAFNQPKQAGSSSNP
jgi:hypothetical protein